MPKVARAALMSTVAVPEGSKVRFGNVNLCPLLRYKMGVTVIAEIATTFLRCSVDLMPGLVIQSPPTAESCLAAGKGNSCDLVTRGGTSRCGASTFGCCADRFVAKGATNSSA